MNLMFLVAPDSCAVCVDDDDDDTDFAFFNTSSFAAVSPPMLRDRFIPGFVMFFFLDESNTCMYNNLITTEVVCRLSCSYR
jgi:hypothetical protein